MSGMAVARRKPSHRAPFLVIIVHLSPHIVRLSARVVRRSIEIELNIHGSSEMVWPFLLARDL